MIAALGLKLVNSLRRFMVPVKCPKCGHEFKPGAEREFASWAELIGNQTCPKCSQRFATGDDERARAANPPGPFRRPKNSQIEDRSVSERERIFHIPSSGNWGGLLPITIIWNLFMVPAFYYFVVLGHWPVRVPQIFFSVFFVVGVGLIFAAFHHRFASYALSLGPEIARLQRSFLLRKNHRLPTREIDGVRRTMAYSQAGGTEDSPIVYTTYCVEVRAGLRSFSFASGLPDADQLWIAWVIRDHVRRCGGTALGAELPKRAGETAELSEA